MTNREFAQQSEDFKRACELAGIKPTIRQASKFVNGHGAAFEAWKHHSKLAVDKDS